MAGGLRGHQATLKCAGAWSGSISIGLEATVADLKASIASASGLKGESELKLISGGRQLQAGSKSLTESGLKQNSRILVLCSSAKSANRVAAQEKASEAEEARTARLQRVREAAAAIAKRSSRYGSNQAYEFALENQAGQAINIGKEDREAIITALIVHDGAKKHLQKGAYQDALSELLVAEEAASLCSDDLLAAVDNVGMLMLDIVWCYFMLQDTSKLAEAEQRLKQARESLHRSYGPNLERMRVLHGNFTPELALFVRLEALEGISAFLRQDQRTAQTSLQSALAKWQRLQVSDEALALLAGMGFSARESKRALQFCNGDTDRAAEFALQQRQAAEARRSKEQKEQHLRRERRRLGTTKNGRLLDMDALEQLIAVGYPRDLAVAALKQSNNSLHAALDVLSNPSSNEALQLSLRPAAAWQPNMDQPAEEAALTGMGFTPQDVRATLAELPPGARMQQAVECLVSRGSSSAAVQRPGGGLSGAAEVAGATGVADHDADSPLQPSAPPAEDGEADDTTVEDHDAEMEQQLAQSVSNDPLSAYDIALEEEGNAIMQYLALIDAQRHSSTC